MTRVVDQDTIVTHTDSLINATFRTLVGTPAFFALAHFDYQVGASFPPAKGAGPVAFRVLQGTLQFNAEGVVTRTPAGSQVAYPIPAGRTFTVTVGDQLVVPGDVVHSARTVGSGSARILGLALFAAAPPRQFPTGINFEPLTLGQVTTLPTAPATAAVQRVALSAGRSWTLDGTHGPRIMHIESGSLTATLQAGTATVSHSMNPFGPTEPLAPGQPKELSAGDGIILQLGGTVQLSGDGCSVLDATVTTGDIGQPTDAAALLLRYAQAVSGGTNADLTSRYFVSNYILHDAVWGEQVGLVGVAGLAKAGSIAFSDWSVSIDEQIAQDDLVADRWQLSCLNSGSFRGNPATNRQARITGMTINRVRNGRIVEGWEAPDVNGLLQQLGLGGSLGELDSEGTDSGNLTAVASRFIYDLWSAGDMSIVDELFAPDYINYTLLNGQQPGRDGIRQFINRWRAAFPDVSVTIDLLVIEGGRAAIRWTSRGTHLGGMLGIPPSGKYITLSGVTMLGVRAGSIVESWQQWNVEQLLAQASNH